MVRKQIVTTSRNRRKASPEKPRTGGPPVIESVAAVDGEVNQIEITFALPVILTALPPWPAIVSGTPVSPLGVVSHQLMTLVIDYGEDVSTATAVQVPIGDQSVRGYTAERVPPGTYPLA